MQTLNLIGLIAAGIGSLSTIGGLFIGLWKIFKKIDSIQDEFKENTLATLRLTIINEHLPTEEKVIAGRKYIDLGGNGAVKKLVMKLEEESANHLLH